jgi:UPF0042 nucleotide-binding protein
MQLILITGLSGSGKSVALNVLEDSGFYCVDNLPPQLVPALIEYRAGRAATALRSVSTRAAAQRWPSCRGTSPRSSRAASM